ncbi:MAG: hypothetical protein SGCHY_005449 [Lobulomycetales sp.]
MAPLFSHIRTPYVAFLAGATVAALGLGGYVGTHFVRNDPAITFFNSKGNRHLEYLKVPQDQNIKLHAVNAFTKPDSTLKPNFKTGFKDL